MPGHDYALSREQAKQPSGSFRRDPTPSQEREQQQRESAQDRRDAYQSMADAGISGLGGQTTGDQAGALARESQRLQGFTPISQDARVKSLANLPAEGRITETAAPTSLVTNVINQFQKAKETGGELLKKLSPLANLVASTQARKTLLTNLKKGEVTDRDRDTLALLLGLERTQGGDFITQSGFDANPELFMSEMEKITELPMDDIQSYFDRMDNMNLGDTAKTMFGDVTGTRDTTGITTLEDITDDLGSEGLAFLKATDPKTYYRLRPNDRDLANVSLQGLSNSPEDRQFAAKIMEARAEAMNRQSRQDANMGQGIMAASPALPGLPVTPFPGGDSMIVTPPPISAPVPSTGITPFNINQFYASLPQYTQQGIMSPNLSRFTDALRMFPGATV